MIVEITLGGHRQADFDRFERAIRGEPEVVSCWSTGGGVDYVLKVVARDVEAYQRLVDGWLEREIGISGYFTYIVTKVVRTGSTAGGPLRCGLKSLPRRKSPEIVP